DGDEQQHDEQIADQRAQGTEHRPRVTTATVRAATAGGRGARTAARSTMETMPDNPAPSAATQVLPEPRDGIASAAPYGAPQLPVTHALNVNENPVGPSPALAEAMGRAVAEVAAGLNRYPDREAHALREDLAAFVAAESAIAVPEITGVWAANGSNEIMHQLLLAYGGPGRTALGFTPHSSMYPEYARDTYTGWITAERGPAPQFALTAQAVTAAIERHRPDVVVLTSPNNPSGTALDLEVVEAAASALAAHRGLLVVDEA